jgi:hypothetical protein
MALHPHLFVPTTNETTRFTSPSTGPRERFNVPARDRAAHAQSLVEQLEAIAPQAIARAEEQRALGLDAGLGIYLRFDSEPNFPLKFESLDLTRSGVQLCNVRTLPDNTMQATVFVPENKLELFLRKIESYRDENTTPRAEGGVARPKNQDLVESISHIQLAALEALWTEETLTFPDQEVSITWELWLRREARVDHLARLRGYAEHFNLTVGEQVLTFVDRTVVLVRGTAQDLARSVDILGMIAEIRLPKVTADFFTTMTSIEQQAWIDELRARIVPPGANTSYICLFDTGVNRGHTLLSPVVAQADLHTYKPAWNVDDRYGHGTEMAGLASFGDLTDVLAAQGPVNCSHRIESVKLINPDDPHDPELYGAVTAESTSRVEVTAARNRVFCMSVTSTDGRDRGRPSSWSSRVDELAAGLDGGPKRLFVLSAGNTAADQRRHYAVSNLTDSIHDPAQSWNALTIGGYTDKVTIDGTKWPQWQPLAPRGDLAASSCTSATWTRWPFKPDIMMEAGNLASNPAIADPADLDDLQLLTTAHNFATRPGLITFGDTSAAAALASRHAAMLWSKYPTMRPETVRALMVHFAEWTPAMRARFIYDNGQPNYRMLLRCCGYGVPNLPRLLSSVDNCLTLIAESELEPFFKDGSDIKTREMRPHPLPWPEDVLSELGNTEVVMRVTLSYFIEPSPGGRGWTPRYGYQSHGLRFAVRNPLETTADFERRINKFARNDEYQAPGLSDPGWRFGRLSGLTSVGSLHSDVWHGTAAALAARGHLAVYPTMGWWNKRPHLGAWDRTARYSLVVTIETPGVETDIYTPVANQIAIPIEIET